MLTVKTEPEWLYLVEEFLEDELCGVHDGVEEAREEDDPAIRACREEVVAAWEEPGLGSAHLV